jgi:HSP20 family protein
MDEVRKREGGMPGQTERTRDKEAIVPEVDILETPAEVVVVADMPGIDEKSVTATLENSILTLEGQAPEVEPQGHRPVRREFRTGNYRRVFSLSDEVDKSGIKATVKNGILRVVLPKSKAASARTIPVTVG